MEYPAIQIPILGIHIISAHFSQFLSNVNLYFFYHAMNSSFFVFLSPFLKLYSFFFPLHTFSHIFLYCFSFLILIAFISINLLLFLIVPSLPCFFFSFFLFSFYLPRLLPLHSVSSHFPIVPSLPCFFSSFLIFSFIYLVFYPYIQFHLIFFPPRTTALFWNWDATQGLPASASLTFISEQCPQTQACGILN